MVLNAMRKMRNPRFKVSLFQFQGGNCGSAKLTHPADQILPCFITLGRYRLHLFLKWRVPPIREVCASAWLCLPPSALWGSLALPTRFHSSHFLLPSAPRSAAATLTLLDSFGNIWRQDGRRFLPRFARMVPSSVSPVR